MTCLLRSIGSIAVIATLAACGSTTNGFGDGGDTADTVALDGTSSDTALDVAHDIAIDHASDSPHSDVPMTTDVTDVPSSRDVADVPAIIDVSDVPTGTDVTDVPVVVDTGSPCGPGQCVVGGIGGCASVDSCCPSAANPACGTCAPICAVHSCGPGMCEVAHSTCAAPTACCPSPGDPACGTCTTSCGGSSDAGSVDGGSGDSGPVDGGDPTDSGGGACTGVGGICSGGLTCCAGGCKNFDNDPLNCGSCGHGCSEPTSMCSDGLCVAPECSPACSAGESCCDVPGPVSRPPTCYPGITCPVGCPLCV